MTTFILVCVRHGAVFLARQVGPTAWLVMASPQTSSMPKADLVACAEGCVTAILGPVRARGTVGD